MRTPARIGTRSEAPLSLRCLWVLGAAVVLLLLAASAASGGALEGVVEPQAAVDAGQSVEDASRETHEVESVTMAIELDEGGVIAVEMARGDIAVDTWNGDEILVIVENVGRSGGTQGKKPAEPISIRVTRDGRDVRIAALDGYGRQLHALDGTGVCLRIMMPRSPGNGDGELNNAYDLSKLTSVVFRALHREALKWILR